MTLAWFMYPDDNANMLVPNHDGRTTDPTINWICGWIDFNAYNQDDTNLTYLKNGLLAPYCKAQTDIYKCPSDKYLCLQSDGMKDRVRSISMNGFLQGGAYYGEASSQGYPLNWSHWYHTAGFQTALLAYNKASDIVKPSPSSLFVFSEEHPDSINDGWMNVRAADGVKWEDLPGSFHGKGTCFSFADGHVDWHEWRVPRYTCPPVLMLNAGTSPAGPDNNWPPGPDQTD